MFKQWGSNSFSFRLTADCFLSWVCGSVPRSGIGESSGKGTDGGCAWRELLSLFGGLPLPGGLLVVGGFVEICPVANKQQRNISSSVAEMLRIVLPHSFCNLTTREVGSQPEFVSCRAFDIGCRNSHTNRNEATHCRSRAVLVRPRIQ